MKAILANQKRTLEVNKLHKEIATMFGGLTLEEILIVGFNWKQEKIAKVMSSPEWKDIVSFFYNWEWYGDEQLSKFKLYNQPAICRHARYRAEFLQDMKNKGYDLNKKYISLPQLEEISCLSIGYATVTYAIKCFLLANYNEDGIKAYKGVQPQTGPVHNASEHLFGHKFTNYQHTTLCNDLALDTDLSPTFINSAFYTIG